MRMAYDQNGTLLVNHGLGWQSAGASPQPPALSGGSNCGCGELGQAATGAAWLPIALLLGGLWAISALISSR
jgi:hypothetical protein